MSAKEVDPSVGTGEFEREIDWLMYNIYGLTDEEIVAVQSA